MRPVPGQTAIITDSTADIPEDQARSLGITVVPAILTIENQTYEDGKDLSRSEFYRLLPELSEPPTTAAPSPQAFTKAYARALAAGAQRILSIHLASKLSGMINVASNAARAFEGIVHVFDSGQVSLGLGFQVLEAASVALSSAPFEAVLSAARRAQERVRLIAMLDTLEYVKRSGRVSWLTAGLGNLLSIKLLIELVDGVIDRLGQVRTRRRGLDELLSIAQSWGPLKHLAVLHTAVPEKAAQLLERLPFASETPPMIVDATTAIGVHTGPGAVGLAGMVL